jgi:hypothetical protein
MTALTRPQAELLHRRLDALVGADRKLHEQWLKTGNLDLQAVPRTYMQSEEGAQDVLAYLAEMVRPDHYV